MTSILSLLHKAGMLQQVKKELEIYKTDIAAIQKIRWKGSGVFDTGSFTLMYSGNEINMFGTILLINRSMNNNYEF
jgi:hypothetical protein